MDLQKNKENFKALVEKYIHRPGIKDLMEWLETTDFYDCPASTRFHGSENGGLCKHSLCVGQRLFELAAVYDKERKYSPESLALVSLFHDICKVGCYKIDYRNQKNEQGQWEKVPYFKWDEQYHFGGHGEKSVYLIMHHHVDLSEEEAAAVKSHMGFSNEPNISVISSVYEDNTLAWMLHVADEAATYIDKY